jgi:hypothetical protein
MRRFMIERELPSIGNATPEDLKGAAKSSNSAIADIGSLLWEHSYVTKDKSFCVYQAKDENTIKRHAEVSGFPATIITEILRMIDPSTADG